MFTVGVKSEKDQKSINTTAKTDGRTQPNF
jgi:hypothetical protein